MLTIPLRTNRDLYLAIDDLTTHYRDSSLSLEAYLLAMLSRSAEFSELTVLTLQQFYDLIASGFTGVPLPFDNTWRDQYDALPYQERGYTGWRATIVMQIVDLREMAECGSLEDDQRYGGISAPRQSSWYNFDPRSYLECAARGSFGGWQLEDHTGMPSVPAAVVNDGSIKSDKTSNEMSSPYYNMSTITWDEIKGFNECGQIYE